MMWIIGRHCLDNNTQLRRTTQNLYVYFPNLYNTTF